MIGHNGSPYIQTERLTKRYEMGDSVIEALSNAGLSVDQGTFTVAMGPSGSGKSTLLHLIGGLDKPTEGSVSVGGMTITALDENDLAAYRRETVGFVFQTFNLIASMSALDNVAYPMRFMGIPRRKRRARALDMLERVGLLDRAYHNPDELSGGQRQRAAIARALINDPRLILADEPTGNLDHKSSEEVMRPLSELHLDGRTVIVVTHDPRMLRYATNTIFLLDGRVVDEAAYQSAMTEENR